MIYREFFVSSDAHVHFKKGYGFRLSIVNWLLHLSNVHKTMLDLISHSLRYVPVLENLETKITSLLILFEEKKKLFATFKNNVRFNEYVIKIDFF